MNCKYFLEVHSLKNVSCDISKKAVLLFPGVCMLSVLGSYWWSQWELLWFCVGCRGGVRESEEGMEAPSF